VAEKKSVLECQIAVVARLQAAEIHWVQVALDPFAPQLETVRDQMQLVVDSVEVQIVVD
jgi:hypothetical protein